jgi:EmrB/QacA subfamily drug resistance transporter
VPATDSLSHARRWLAFIVLLAGGFLPPVDFFIVNVTLPSIEAKLGATAAELQLVVSGYAASYAVFLITGGRLGDLFGRRRLFLLGMAGFTIANLACGLAATPLQLVAWRLVQGFAAAMLVPQVLGPLRTLFPTDRELARAMSSYGIMMGLAAAAGQFLGGALTQWSPFELGWRAVFLLKLPVCLMVLVAGWALVPETGASRHVRLDFGGAALISAALACLVLPLAEGRQQGWPAWTLIMLAAAPVLAIGFVRFEARLTRRGGMPILDVALMAIPSFRRGVVVGTLFFFTTAFYVTFSLYQQQGRGTDPLFTGLAILPYGIGLFFGPVTTAPLVPRFGAMLLPIGMAIQVAGYAGTAVAVAFGADGWPEILAVLIAGFGQGIALPRLFNAALGDVPPAQAGVAAAMVNSALQIGGSISVAAVGSLFFAVLADGSGHEAYGHAFAVAQAATSAALAGAMLLSMRGRFRVAALDRSPSRG